MPPGAGFSRGGGPGFQTARQRRDSNALGKTPQPGKLVKDRKNHYPMAYGPLENAVISLDGFGDFPQSNRRSLFVSLEDNKVKCFLDDTRDNHDLRTRIWHMEEESGKLVNLYG
eukprot:CAMPEP_0197850586 /NCGR_PEP_ID=MMETSP1438-20131217/15770_1 /TAXON_ID=1461541 /ORGANISM="Pterosperma sp., Strain CCMP1384" /LENGTH=113 /DNA_ID=CAMNT_0043463817 /DNA_START=326 /DNA_END=664 /DNA_ORIENTATION=-